MAEPGRVIYRLESAEGRAHVSLDDFAAQITALRSALERTDRATAGGRATLHWEVVGLSHSSPATIELKASRREDGRVHPDRPQRVIDAFRENVDLLAAGKPPWRQLDHSALQAYNALATPVKQGRVRAEFEVDTGRFPIPDTVEEHTASILAEDLETSGMFKGRLEFLNIHGRKNEFRIYPVAGPRFVTCEFPSQDIERAKAGVGRSVEVRGKLVYKARSPFPYRIVVEEITPVPNDEELPSLMSLRGAVPDATNGLPSEDFVRELRDGS